MNKNPRPANWPPEATQEQINAHVERTQQEDRHRPKKGRLVYVPEGSSIYVYRVNTGAGYDGRSAD